MLLDINTTQNLNLKKINKFKIIICKVATLITATLIVEELTVIEEPCDSSIQNQTPPSHSPKIMLSVLNYLYYLPATHIHLEMMLVLSPHQSHLPKHCLTD